MIRDEEMIKEKLKFYDGDGAEIHLSLFSNEFRNGKIISLNDDSLIIDEFKLGRTIILIREIRNVERRRIL